MTLQSAGENSPAVWGALLLEAAEFVWPVSRHAVDPGSAAHVVAQTVSVRVSRLLRACAVLSDSGYAVETAGLVRSIWEDAVSVAYMAASPDERCQQWIDFAETRRAHQINWALARPGGLDAETLTMLKDAATDATVSARPWWSGCTPSSMAAALTGSDDEFTALLARDFVSLYQTLSDDAHGSPFALEHLLVAHASAAFADVGPDGVRNDDLAGLALYGAWQLVHALSRLGEAVDEDPLRQLVGRAHTLIRGATP